MYHLAKFLIILGCIIPLRAFGFGCTPTSEGGTFVITADVPLLTPSSQIDLVSLENQNFSCSGSLAYYNQDAIKVIPGSVKINNKLAESGYSAYLKNQQGSVYPASQFPDPFCIWPSYSCDGTTLSHSGPVYLTVGLFPPRKSATSSVVIKPLEEIIRFVVRQRGNYGEATPTWGDNTYTFVVRSKNEISIPSYSCTVNDESVHVN